MNKSSILKTSLITIVYFVALIVIVFWFMCIVSPIVMGNFLNDLQLTNYASNLYFREYNNSKNIGYLYKSLNLDIKQNNYRGIIEKYDMLSCDDNYQTLLDNLKQNALNSNSNLLIKSSILNEETNLFNHYLSSKIIIGDGYAFDIALDEFSNYSSSTLENNGIYLFDLFITQNSSALDYNRFEYVYPKYFSNNLRKEINYYFVHLEDLFLNKYNEGNLSINEKAYLIATGNRIITVGNNLKVLNSVLTDGTSNILLTDKMNNINNKIVELLG